LRLTQSIKAAPTASQRQEKSLEHCYVCARLYRCHPDRRWTEPAQWTDPGELLGKRRDSRSPGTIEPPRLRSQALPSHILQIGPIPVREVEIEACVFSAPSNRKGV